MATEASVRAAVVVAGRRRGAVATERRAVRERREADIVGGGVCWVSIIRWYNRNA